MHDPANRPARRASRRTRLGGALAAIALAELLAASPAAAEVSLEQVGTFAQPVHVASEPDDHERLYVVERARRVQLVTGAVSSQCVDLTSIVVSTPGSERGLLSVAFPPDHSETGLLYVFYTGAGGALTVAELHSDGDTASPPSLRVVLTKPAGARRPPGDLELGAAQPVAVLVRP